MKENQVGGLKIFATFTVPAVARYAVNQVQSLVTTVKQGGRCATQQRAWD